MNGERSKKVLISELDCPVLLIKKARTSIRAIESKRINPWGITEIQADFASE